MSWIVFPQRSVHRDGHGLVTAGARLQFSANRRRLLVNGLAAVGLTIEHLDDRWHQEVDLDAEPGTWAHLVTVCPPWLALWARASRT
jgi:hypothetical protein